MSDIERWRFKGNDYYACEDVDTELTRLREEHDKHVAIVDKREAERDRLHAEVERYCRNVGEYQAENTRLRNVVTVAEAENTRLRSLNDDLRRHLDETDQQGEFVTRDRDAWRETAYANDRARQNAEAKFARLREALEDCKHFLLQMKQETLGPLFGMANYKHEADRLYDLARNALKETEEVTPIQTDP